MEEPKSNRRKLVATGEGEKEEMKMRLLARKAIQVLEKKGYAPSLNLVSQVAQELFPKEDSEAIVRAIVKGCHERAKGFFDTLWPFLGVFSPPIEVEEALREGRGVSVWLSRGEKWTEVDFVVEGKHQKDKYQKRFSLRRRIPVPLRIESRITGLQVVVGNVYVKVRDGKANAFLRTEKEEKRALEAVRYFRPLLEVLDLADLEGALETLANLPPWEKGRVEGGYFMAKSPYFSVLRRGLVLGDPALDGAFFRREPVVLSYPEGTELFLEAAFFYESEEWYTGFGRLEVKITWRGETVRPHSDISMSRWDFVSDDPVSFILRHHLRIASYYGLNCSPAMRLFLRKLANRNNILKALGDREFHRNVLREVALEALASF